MNIPSYIKKPLNALLTTYFRYVLIAVVVLIGAIGYLQLIRPQFENVKIVGVLAYQNASDRLDNRRSYYSKASEMVNTYREVSAAQTVNIEEIMPTTIDNSKLFLTLQALSKQAGMSMVSMALSKGSALAASPTGAAPTAGTQDAATAPASNAVTSSNGTVNIINATLTMTGSGDYDSYIKLLTTIERSMRIFDLGSIAYSPVGAAVGTEAAQEMPSFTFELKTYYLDQSTAK